MLKAGFPTWWHIQVSKIGNLCAISLQFVLLQYPNPFQKHSPYTCKNRRKVLEAQVTCAGHVTCGSLRHFKLSSQEDDCHSNGCLIWITSVKIHKNRHRFVHTHTHTHTHWSYTFFYHKATKSTCCHMLQKLA